MFAKVNVIRGWSFPEPKPGFPNRGGLGEKHTVSLDVARQLAKEGHAEIVGFIEDPASPSPPTKKEEAAAQDALESAVTKERAILDEAKRVGERLDAIKSERYEVAPDKVGEVEAEQLQLERTKATLRQRLRTAGAKVSPLRQQYLSIRLRRTVAEANETVAKSIDPLAAKFAKAALPLAEEAVSSVASAAVGSGDVPPTLSDALVLLRDALDRAVAKAQGLRSVKPETPKTPEAVTQEAFASTSSLRSREL